MPEQCLSGIKEGRVLRVGDLAPDFQLPALVAGVKKTFRLSEYRAQKNVVLAYYPSNWEETSARQIREYQAQRGRVLAAQTEIVGITVDSIMNITAWEREIGPIDFPLCSDFWPHGQVSTEYGVLRKSGENAGAAKRAIVIVDRGGRIAFCEAYSDHVIPPLEDIFRVLGTLP